jgi:hypothetical protein
MTKAKKNTVKTSRQKRPIPPSSDILDAPLSPQWAFLVQFRAVPGGPTYDAGRIEHLVSGRTSHFQSLKELSTYLVQELCATDKT